MRNLKPKPLLPFFRLADKLMKPIMFLLGGFKPDSIQETHPWHAQSVDPRAVDLAMAVLTPGSDQSKHANQKFFLFHAPIFHGWTRYTTYEIAPTTGAPPFYIGWVSLSNSGQTTYAAVHRLPINDTRIRTLDGPIGHQNYFFAISASGTQIPLRAIGRGQLGDGQFPDVRLF